MLNISSNTARCRICQEHIINTPNSIEGRIDEDENKIIIVEPCNHVLHTKCHHDYPVYFNNQFLCHLCHRVIKSVKFITVVEFKQMTK